MRCGLWKQRKNRGGEIEDYLVPVGRFDPEIVGFIGSDDSIHFWYTFGTQLAAEEELGNEIGLVLAIRTLMEFVGLHSDGVTELGEKRQMEGQEKLQKGERDRIVKIECAAILAAQSISRKRGMTNVACEVYQYYVCRFPPSKQALLDENFEKYDLVIKENYLQ